MALEFNFQRECAEEKHSSSPQLWDGMVNLQMLIGLGIYEHGRIEEIMVFETN